MRSKTVLVASAMTTLILTRTATATFLSAALPYEQFGHLENATIDGKEACAATSIIKSFVYLQNAYPSS
ncbi:MAG TPA: hypothetical protein DD670_09425 [Planctomycetaceae bacterium]|nr:hypothetical protein [Planctomycetaceae bacterium]